MIKINVILNNITWKKYLKNPHEFIENKVKLLNKKNKLFKKNTFICSLLLSDTKEIKNLNKKFRKKNKSTDILSFPFYEKKALNYKIKSKQKEIYLGDIIINLNSIKTKGNLNKFTYEFNKIWIHGLAHLFGYTHKKNQDFFDMKRIEKKYINILK